MPARPPAAVHDDASRAAGPPHAHSAASRRATQHTTQPTGTAADAPVAQPAHPTTAFLGTSIGMASTVLHALQHDDGLAGTMLAAVLALLLVVGRALRARRASEAQLRAIFEYAAIGIVVQGEDGTIHDANPAFERIVQRQRNELRGMRASDFAPPEDARAVDELPALAHALGGGDRVTVEQRFRRRDGALRRCELTVSRVGGALTSGRALIGLVQDVTHHRELQDELHFRAYHDSLTRLANRARFRERTAAALDSATGSTDGDAANVAVLLIDLDGFKLVNDTAGHAAGDALLIEVAQRLLNATRGCDVVARLGGDEFGVLLTNVGGDDDVLTVADRVITAVMRPIPIDGTTARVGASIGIARGGARPGLVHDGTIASDPVGELLRDADLALYAAKDAGKGRAVMFAADMHAAVVGRLALETALRDALGRNEFRLNYQPIVNLADGALVGVEALVRWNHPDRGILGPAEFIGVAEETGVIVPLGRWVLQEACRHGAEWQRAAEAAGHRDRPFTVAVNVSGRQVARPEFVGEVETALAVSGLSPDWLVLELTESTVVHHPEAARRRLDALKALGIRLAIDDFGTGYSALSYLRQFPIDVLKVDKSFIDEIAEGGQPAALAGAIVALAGALGLHTVAEGVESEAQVTRLREMGCGRAQGFYFAPPLDPQDITAALAGSGVLAGSPVAAA